MQKRLPRVAGLNDMIPTPAEDAARYGAHLVVILYEKDRLGAVQGLGRYDRANNIDRIIHARQGALEGRALSLLAVDPNAPPALLHDPKDGREAQARPFA